MTLFYIILILLIIIFLIFLKIRGLSNTISYSSKELTTLEVTTSKLTTDTESINSSAISAENMFVSFHGLLHDELTDQDIVSTEIVFSGKSGIKFYITCPNEVARFVQSQLYAHHSNLTIKPVQDYTHLVDENDNIQAVEANLSLDYFVPIKTHRDFEIDPMSSFTSALSQLDTDEEFWFQIISKPIADTWQEKGLIFIKSIREGTSLKADNFLKVFYKIFISEFIKVSINILKGLFVPPSEEEIKEIKKEKVALSSNVENQLNIIENKVSRVGFKVNIRALSHSSDKDKAASTMRAFMAALKQYTSVNYNSFSINQITEDGLKMYKSRFFKDNDNFILNSEELATIYHFPYSNIETPNISWEYSKLSEPPSNLPVDNCIYLGDTIFRNQKTRFGLTNDSDRLRHMYLVGKTGVGKSTLFQVMAIQDIKNGEGICILDPHGETIDNILEYIPEERLDDVVYVDPSDSSLPVGINLLESAEDASSDDKNILASGILAAVKHQFGDISWGPRLEYLLSYSLLTLTSIKGTTMLSIVRLLTDKNYRNFIVEQLDDPVLKKFWEVEYKEYTNNQKFISEAISPIQNKVNRFLASPVIRNLLCQGTSSINLKEIMDNKKILLINLSKGKIGEDNSYLLGALLVSRIQFYALQRAKIPPEKRTPFYLYVDEFQNFATSTFGEILSESRKYGLGLYLTNQYTNQLSDDILHAVLGNVGTIATFSAGAEDSKVMASEFSPFTEEDINTLKRFQIYIKLMIDGMTSLPFSGRILLPWEDADFLPKKTGNREKAIQRSREKYGRDRNFIESKIQKWIDTKFDKGMAIRKAYHEKKNKNTNKVENKS